MLKALMIMIFNFCVIYGNDSKVPTHQVNNIDGKLFQCQHGTLLSSSVCIPYGYLIGEVPDAPTIVNTKLEINNIREVSNKKMRITLDFYLELFWVDDRLKTSLSSNEVSVLNNNLIDKIWKPDLWIQNLCDFKLHSVLEPTGGFFIGNMNRCNPVFCKQNQTKQKTFVTYNMEAEATIYCNFKFLNYPMDTQYCNFVMDGSYPYRDIIELRFEVGHFGYTNENANIDEFDIEITFDDKTNQTGMHSRIRMKRHILPFIIKYYLPCIAIITVSLINFLISIYSIPARVALLVTQFLTLTNILIAQQAESPSSGQFTALGIYLLASLFFVVLGLVEFACVLYLHQCNERHIRKSIPPCQRKMNIVCISKNDNGSIVYKDGDPIFDILQIDRIAFVVVGAFFFVFNVFYWSIFMILDFNYE